MGKIVGQIQVFNSAFKVAWDLAVEEGKLSPGIGLKLSDAIRRLMKDSSSDAAEIGMAAYEAVLKG